MEKRECNIITVLAVVIAILLGVLVCGAAYFALYRPLKDQQAQLTEIQAQLREIQTVARFRPAMPFPQRRNDVAAADSIEGKLRSQGKHWVRTPGEITVGAYVEDIYEGRLNQPQG